MEQTEKSLRYEVNEYIKTKYNAEPEFLWSKFPNYAVYRHAENRKWFGIIMDVKKSRLGNFDDTVADILNVKLSSDMEVAFFMQQDGIFKGYHISRGSWISILLDGTVSLEAIYGLIDERFAVTLGKKFRNK